VTATAEFFFRLSALKYD